MNPTAYLICFTFLLYRFKVFRSVVNGATPSLKRLAQQFLGIEIQTGEHSSVITRIAGYAFQ
jgi:hypothetical protein